MRTFRFVLVAIVATSIACGGGGNSPTPSTAPTGPTSNPTTPFTMRVVDENNIPVAGATVDLGGGVKKSTGIDGKLVLEVPAGNQPTVTIDAAGFHGPWVTKIRTSVTDYKMMRLVGITSKIIEESVYGDVTAENNPGKRPALILKNDLYIHIDSGLMATYPELNRVVEETVWLNGMLEGRISAKAGIDPGITPVVFQVSIDPSMSAGGMVSRKFYDDGRISGGTLTFQRAGALSVDLIRHELLHILGLNHYVGDGLLGLSVGAEPSSIDKLLLKYISFLTPRTVSVRDDTLVLTLFPTAFSSGMSRQEIVICNR